MGLLSASGMAATSVLRNVFMSPGGLAWIAAPLGMAVITLVSYRRRATIHKPNALNILTRLPELTHKLGWVFIRLFKDLLQMDSLPTAVPTNFPWQVRKARFWEMMDVTHFDHAIFPKPNHKLDTLVYLLKMKLAGGASLFTIREPHSPHRLIGTVYLRKLRQPGIGFISNVAVHEEFRRRGIAEYMMIQLALPEARKIGFHRIVLNVLSDSFVQRFYEKLGFRLYRGQQFEIYTPPGESPMDMNLP